MGVSLLSPIIKIRDTKTGTHEKGCELMTKTKKIISRWKVCLPKVHCTFNSPLLLALIQLWDSSVSIATGYGLDNQGVGV
jgi:hypothetical protein